MKSVLIVTFMSILLLFVIGCGGKKVKKTDILNGDKPDIEDVNAIVEERTDDNVLDNSNLDELELSEDEQIKQVFKIIYFDYKKYEIPADGIEVLSEIARYMSDNPNITVAIEGHCDERGSSQYNMVLGEKRASGVMEFLTSYGIEKARVNTISYGEEHPADRQGSEEAHALNRRAEFKVRKK